MPASSSTGSLVLATALLVSLSSGCAVRYDATGEHRIGIGLWGFGDPPGVDWNLDRQRSDTPELPPSGKRDIPELPPLGPRTLLPRGADIAAARAPHSLVSFDRAHAITDNRERAFDRGSDPRHRCASLRGADPCDVAPERGS